MEAGNDCMKVLASLCERISARSEWWTNWRNVEENSLVNAWALLIFRHQSLLEDVLVHGYICLDGREQHHVLTMFTFPEPQSWWFLETVSSSLDSRAKTVKISDNDILTADVSFYLLLGFTSWRAQKQGPIVEGVSGLGLCETNFELLRVRIPGSSCDEVKRRGNWFTFSLPVGGTMWPRSLQGQKQLRGQEVASL